MRTEFPVKDEDIQRLRVRVLRDLAASQYPREALASIAMKHDITFDDAKALVERHGWPEARSMGRAADALEGKLPAPVPPAPSTGAGFEVFDRKRAAPSTRQDAPRPTPMANGTELLIVSAEKSAKARTRRLAAKVREDLGVLRDLVVAERKETEAAKVKAEETARLKAEVAELEQQLAAKKAALRPPSKPKQSQPKPASQRDSKAIRAWAAENGVECPGFGRVPQPVVEAYEAAHPSEGVSE